MTKHIILKTHIKMQRHSAHYETAMIDLRAPECDLNPLISFEEFYIYGPVFQPSPHAGIVRLTLLLPDTTGTLHFQVGNREDSLHAGELFCMNSGSGVLFQETVSPTDSVIHGITVLLNTHSTLKSLPVSTYIIGCNLDEDSLAITIDGKGYDLGDVIFEVSSGVQARHYSLKKGDKYYVYVLDGEVQNIDRENWVKGDFITVNCNEDIVYSLNPVTPSRIIVIRARTIDEKTTLLGSLVMNSQDQINAILDKYQTGKL